MEPQAPANAYHALPPTFSELERIATTLNEVTLDDLNTPTPTEFLANPELANERYKQFTAGVQGGIALRFVKDPAPIPLSKVDSETGRILATIVQCALKDPALFKLADVIIRDPQVGYAQILEHSEGQLPCSSLLKDACAGILHGSFQKIIENRVQECQAHSDDSIFEWQMELVTYETALNKEEKDFLAFLETFAEHCYHLFPHALMPDAIIRCAIKELALPIVQESNASISTFEHFEQLNAMTAMTRGQSRQ